MGSLDIESDQRPEHEIVSSGGELMVDSPTISDKNDILELMSEPTSTSDSDANESIVISPTAFSDDDGSGSDKQVFAAASRSSSVSSTDFSLEDPLQDFDNKHGEKNNYASESPPIQVMERPTTSKYRIPSSVFTKKKSTSTEWGRDSNESLFSIDIGSMSFCNLDSMNWRSGELDLGFILEPSPSSSGKPINSPYEDQFQDFKPLEDETNPEWDETGKTHGSDASGKSHELGEESIYDKWSVENNIHSLSEISSSHQSSIEDDVVKLNSQDNREDQGHKSAHDEQTSHISTESKSKDSFAFPSLTADTNDVSGTAKSEARLETEPQPSGTKADTPAASWTRCFRCCTFCS